MKSQSLGSIVASAALTFLFYACATNGGKPPSSRELIISEAGGDPNSGCKWKFNRDPSQKNKVSGPIVLETNPGGVCKVDPASTAFYIGTSPTAGLLVKDMDAKDFLLEGSCKRCYANTAGGMSCVTYPGC
jgi:hypothetical protein